MLFVVPLHETRIPVKEKVSEVRESPSGNLVAFFIKNASPRVSCFAFEFLLLLWPTSSMDDERVGTTPGTKNATTAALRLYLHVCDLPGQLIWSEDAYTLLEGWGLTRTQCQTALRKSGLYPVRARTQRIRVRWQVAKPFPWTPVRTPGQRPQTIRTRCVVCGQRFIRPDRMRPVDEWDW